MDMNKLKVALDKSSGLSVSSERKRGDTTSAFGISGKSAKDIKAWFEWRKSL